MDPMETATTVERQLLERARHTHTPINGSLELLPICNMNCDMCYVRLSREEVQSLGGLHTADEWITVGQQMKEAGVLFLLLTGGEPLLFPDFKRLYMELRSMGFIITINTNGTLVDEEWADFFGRNKPRRVNITLYGANGEEYSRLCHYPAGFEKTVRGIRLLRQAGVDVKISCSVTKVNQYSLKQIFALGDELDAPVHIDPYMVPAVRERKKPFSEQARISPQDAARVSMEALKLQFPEDMLRQYVEQAAERAEDPDFPRGDGHISCLAGNCSFTVNWQGLMRPCVVLSEPSASVFEKGFAQAWTEIGSAAKKLVISPKCTACRFKPICKTCAAAAVSETGDYEGIPEYLCQFSEEYYRIIKEMLEAFHGEI
jgi:radical SAM protein with 4Fe4S-binding SPASM domain